MAQRGVNKVILVGNLGQDPEVKFLPSGGAVTNVSIATSESWRDKQSGEQVERTEWHRVVFFNRLAEIVGEYLRKGSKVYLEGKLQTRKWQDQSGQDRYSTEIVAAEMQMLDARGGDTGGGMGGAAPMRSGSSGSGGRGGSGGPGGYAGGAAGAAGAAAGQPNAPAQPAPSFDDFDDDIPF